MDELTGVALAFAAVQVGRLAVWIVSMGRWRGEKSLGDEGRIFGAAGALSFVRDGQRVITETGLLFAGIAFLVLSVVAAAVIYVRW